MGTKDSKHSNSQGNTLFRSAVGDTKPIKQRDRDQSKPRDQPPRRSSQKAKHPLTVSLDTDSYALPETGPGDKLNFQRRSVSRKMMRDLRRGKYPIGEEIDLHGMTSTEAHEALHDFIGYCARRRLACIRIVHGKGLGSGSRGPILKAGVDSWLRQWDEVLAYCSALDRDGGTGAVYVLLKSL